MKTILMLLNRLISSHMSTWEYNIFKIVKSLFSWWLYFKINFEMLNPLKRHVCTVGIANRSPKYSPWLKYCELLMGSNATISLRHKQRWFFFRDVGSIERQEIPWQQYFLTIPATFCEQVCTKNRSQVYNSFPPSLSQLFNLGLRLLHEAMWATWRNIIPSLEMRPFKK